jgi:hypothetical protein
MAATKNTKGKDKTPPDPNALRVEVQPDDNRAVRRTRWLQRKWRVSAKGNSFLNVDGHNLGVHVNKFKRWGYRIGSRFSAKTYATKDEAKLALFDEFWATTQDDVRLWATD